MDTCNVVLAGVGGQGILLAAEMLGTAAVKEGYNVRVSELHGMAQRGGAVVSHVRIGEKALAPTVLEGTADVIVGFEPMEALRNIRFASRNTIVLANTKAFKISGAEYPPVEKLLEQLRSFTRNIVPVNAATLAEKAGAVITQNIVMIGALAATGKLPLKTETLKEALRELVPAKYLDINMRAFELGYNAVKTLHAAV
ncbi:indolepyruvate ferredoxin oxidoreductase subunit beta [Candidatus Bathyarchaeota archaeon]|nr:indolepyruvate ferredoxin oxidoreductase subunit beta [Candidatus Bathyarchaeota archaeon]